MFPEPESSRCDKLQCIKSLRSGRRIIPTEGSRMSTEVAAAQTPDLAKKGKKSKDGVDSSAKKRKREEEAQANGENTGAEPEKKKSKKRKSKGGEDVNSGATTVQSAPATASPQAAEKAATESKTNGLSAPATEEGAESAKKKAKKTKRKTNKDGGAAEAGATGTAPEEKQPEPLATLDKPGNAFRSEKKKIKKSKKSHETSATASNTARSSGPLNQQRPSKPLSTVPPTEESDEILKTNSPFAQQTASFYLALSPCANDFPLEGLCAEHISPLLLSYYPPLDGIVLSYDNARLSESPEAGIQARSASNNKEARTVLARSIDEYAVTYVWLTADFVLFRPQRGAYLEGYVNLQNESLLGLVCYNYFNAGIEWNRLPSSWRWVSDEEGALAGNGKGKKAAQEGEGHWVDGSGKKVDGKLIFRVRDFEATPGSELGAGSINIYGTLISEADEKALEDGGRRLGT